MSVLQNYFDLEQIITGEKALAVIDYWSDYVDHGSSIMSSLNGWIFKREKVGNTIVLSCIHPKLGFTIVVSFEQKENQLIITIPKNNLEEQKFHLHSIQLLPWMGERHEGDDGTFIIPQQSGVVSNFKNKPEAGYEIGIYGGGLSECNMPIWGIETPGSLMAGVITQGYCDAAFVLENAIGKDKRYRIYPKLFFRHEMHVRRQKFPISCDDFKIQYTVLKTGKRSGAGILAEHYRNYLLNVGRIQTITEKIKDSPVLEYSSKALEIRIRCASKWPFPPQILEQTPDNEHPVHVFVNFDQIRKIVQTVKRHGIPQAEFCLVGWNAKGHDGRYPQLLPVEELLGGEAKLRKLLKETLDMGYLMSGHDNQENAYTVSEDWDENILALTQDGYPMKDGVWGGGQAYDICPEAMYHRYSDRNLETVKNQGFRGTHFTDCLSSTGLKQCWNPAHPLTKTGTAKWRVNILKLIKKKFGAVQSEGPLDFAAGVLDRVLYIDTFDAEELAARDYIDQTIPLYEMVYHGILMYNVVKHGINALPGSEYYLKNLSFGGMPVYYFYKRFTSAPEIRTAGTTAPESFSYEKLEEEAAVMKKSYDDHITTLGHLQKCFITDFERISDSLTRTEYSNGEHLYVNFGPEDISINEKIVSAKSFTLATN